MHIVVTNIYIFHLLDRSIFFETLYLLEDDSYVKKTHFSTICPSTPAELKDFAEQIPMMLRWRDAVVAWTIAATKRIRN